MSRFFFKQHKGDFGEAKWLPCFGLIILFFSVIFAVFGCSDVYAAGNVTIVIDAGHGGEVKANDETNSGAVYHGLEEKNVNLITATALYDELSQYENVTLYMTRDEDVEVSIDRRAEFAYEVGADLLVSVHYNASADHNLFGAEVFTSAFGDSYGVGHALGEMIMQEWENHGSIRKDVKTRIGKSGQDYYGLIRFARAYDIPAIILEHGYLDNDKDYLRIKSESAWKELGIADATAIAKFYGLEKGVVKENVGPTVDVSAPEDAVMPDETEPSGVRLEIDNYNSNKGDIDFTLYAYDDESALMYYGFKLGDDINKDTVFYELEKWDGKNGKLVGTYHIQPGYEGKITAAVYNVYQLDAKSNSVELIPDEEAPDDEEDNAVIDISDDNAADETEGVLSPDAQNAAEDNADDAKEISWMIRGNPPESEFTARANAIDKNTESTVKNSYVGLIVAFLIAGMAVAVLIVLSVSSANQKRKRRRKKNAREKNSYDWMDD